MLSVRCLRRIRLLRIGIDELDMIPFDLLQYALRQSRSGGNDGVNLVRITEIEHLAMIKLLVGRHDNDPLRRRDHCPFDSRLRFQTGRQAEVIPYTRKADKRFFRLNTAEEMLGIRACGTQAVVEHLSASHAD